MFRIVHLEKLFFTFLWCVNRYTEPYNLDTQHVSTLSGPNGSFFGYSVMLHAHEDQTWVLVGAPVADSKSYLAAKTPGAVYKCTLNDSRHCEQIQISMTGPSPCGSKCSSEVDNQWLGVSLSRRHGDGLLLACAHRWKNIYYLPEGHKLPLGICYQLDGDLVQSIPLIPCYRNDENDFGNDYTFCQAGTSSFLLEDLIVMGAPGTKAFTGSVIAYNTSTRVTATYIDDGTVQFGSYLGYSVSAGHFLSADSIEVVGGAPQYSQTGMVYIFGMQSVALQIIAEVTGSQRGSYFGASVCAVDLNSDGMSDLLVGAPMFSSVREEGRVHVYINKGHANLTEQKFTLAGRDSYAARFGQTIISLGDLDHDGYHDVAVGAPQENDLQGAVYIYNGRKTGLGRDYSQRISGSVMGNAFKMFGQSLSGGIDVDGNGYTDVAIGAFLTDSAVVLRTRAVVVVEAWLLLPESVNHSQPLCSDNGQSTVCINTSICFRLGGRHSTGHVDMFYNLTADVKHKAGLRRRLYFSTNGTARFETTTGMVKTTHGNVTCTTHQAFLRRDVRDIFSPLVMELHYELGGQHREGAPSLILPPLTPILQRGEEQRNQLTNQTLFARYCVFVNCSTNLQLSAQLVTPRSHKGVGFIALGEGKTFLLKVTLGNIGDAAFLPTLHLRYPDNLHFIKALTAGEQHFSCQAIEEKKESDGVDCRLGNLFLNVLAKVNVSFLMEVGSDSGPGDLNVTITASRENFESEDLLHDNVVVLILPLRYGVNLNIHGFASRQGFEFGDFNEPNCHTERFNYTIKVVNAGPSLSQGTRVEVVLPRALAPYSRSLLRILHVQASTGGCSIRSSEGSTPLSVSTSHSYWPNIFSTTSPDWSNLSSTMGPDWSNLSSTMGLDSSNLSSTMGLDWSNLSSTTGPDWSNLSSTMDPHRTDLPSVSSWPNESSSSVEGEECEVKRPPPWEELIFFFSRRSKRQMYCMRQDALCVYVVCELGDLAAGRDANVHIEVEMTPAVLNVSPGRHAVMEHQTTAVVTPRRHPSVWFLTHDPSTEVVLKAWYSYNMAPDVKLMIQGSGVSLGLLIFLVLAQRLRKHGFFRRQFKKEDCRRLSWDSPEAANLKQRTND
ncbi:integrin alpha-4 [Hypomesus transpacificus]|uniref:integrin alpha-4 n=1 Tax=Hypomesus transpacificus TaxID=137520 RepID=UPI001F0810ED|nr:integrin alpha-4 [Hypomesus transpacificus]